MRKNWLLLLLATLMITSQNDAFAQQQRKEKYRSKANDPVKDLPYYKKLRWADDLFKEGSYFNAIEYYQQLKQEQERNPYLAYQLAECYWITRDYVPAAHYYHEAYSLASKLYPEAIYKSGVMLKMQGKYEEAIAQFQQFIDDNPKTFKNMKLRAQRQIEGAQMAMNSIKDPIPVTIVNAGPNVNTAYTESAPYPLGDSSLLFATMRQNDPVEVNRRERGSYMSKLMVSHKQKFTSQVDSFQWPLLFDDGPFNSDDVHVGNGVFSPGGDRFYFTRCKEGDSTEVICKIYVSHFEGAAWGEPEELGSGINEEGSNTQPFVAMVGKKEILFFSSNRKLQSRGGYDIWYSVIDPRNNSYRRPQNAGKQINTDQDEVTPYYDSREGKLYFASNGWVTMGGFDIFSAVGGPSRYHDLTNLGYPINTSADELYYIKDPVGKPDAYLVSNRIGSIALKNPTCCDDIWRVQYEPNLRVVGRVVDRATNQPMNDVVAKIVDQDGDMRTFNSADGSFGFHLMRGKSYVITGDKENYASTRASVNTMDVQRTDPDDSVSVTIYMDAITPEYRFQLSNIYYDYDKADLRPESRASLDSLIQFMNDNPSLNIEVYSFTDGRGSAAYNNELSIRRADAVIRYLEQAGIDPSRMSAKGFGSEMPAAPNTVNGRDNPQGRQLNRRTEVRIVTDVPTRRVLYDSSKPGDMDAQMNNLRIDESQNSGGGDDYDRPGSRVND